MKAVGSLVHTAMLIYYVSIKDSGLSVTLSVQTRSNKMGGLGNNRSFCEVSLGDGTRGEILPEGGGTVPEGRVRGSVKAGFMSFCRSNLAFGSFQTESTDIPVWDVLHPLHAFSLSCRICGRECSSVSWTVLRRQWGNR